MAAVLVHIDLEAGRPDSSSLVALAAGRTLATSWGAALYAGVIASPAEGRAAEPALARAGADRIVVAPVDAPAARFAPLWDAIGPAWLGAVDRVRPRIALFGADAPSAVELAPRTAARLGARLLLRARAIGNELEDAALRDRDGAHARSTDGGAVVALIGRAPAAIGSERHVAVAALAPAPREGRVEITGDAAADATYARALVAIGADVAGDPQLVANARRLAALVGARVVTEIDRAAPLAPELCVRIGGAELDLAGATRAVAIGGGGKQVGRALPGDAAAALADLVDRLEHAR